MGFDNTVRDICSFGFFLSFWLGRLPHRDRLKMDMFMKVEYFELGSNGSFFGTSLITGRIKTTPRLPTMKDGGEGEGRQCCGSGEKSSRRRCCSSEKSSRSGNETRARQRGTRCQDHGIAALLGTGSCIQDGIASKHECPKCRCKKTFSRDSPTDTLRKGQVIPSHHCM